MNTIVFFNNKGGVGKTSLVYHVSWMFSELGVNVVAADLDPQSNLSAMFLDEDRLEDLWPDDVHQDSVLGMVQPILKGIGDIADPHVEDIADNIGLVVGADLNTMTASWDYKSLILGLDRGIPTIIGRCVVLQRAKTPDV
jgi:cellulose biosynthesis protein BcsQ